jgi:hypothetical protein
VFQFILIDWGLNSGFAFAMLALAKQALYCLSHTSSSKIVCINKDKS